ncbi:hypothetical protein GVAV_000827 [Gurleya vavrai]
MVTFVHQNMNLTPEIDKVDLKIQEAINSVLLNYDLSKKFSKSIVCTTEIENFLENKTNYLINELIGCFESKTATNIYDILAQKSSEFFFKHIIDILLNELKIHYSDLKIENLSDIYFKSIKPTINEYLIELIVKKHLFPTKKMEKIILLPTSIDNLNQGFDCIKNQEPDRDNTLLLVLFLTQNFFHENFKHYEDNSLKPNETIEIINNIVLSINFEIITERKFKNCKIYCIPFNKSFDQTDNLNENNFFCYKSYLNMLRFFKFINLVNMLRFFKFINLVNMLQKTYLRKISNQTYNIYSKEVNINCFKILFCKRSELLIKKITELIDKRKNYIKCDEFL